MLFETIIFVTASLGVLVTAQPVSEAGIKVLTKDDLLGNGTTSVNLNKRWPGPGACGDSFFFDRTSDASPWASNCQALADRLKRDHPGNENVYYVLPNTDEDPIRAYTNGDCIFGLRKAYAGPQFADTFVGTDDVIDLIQSSIQMYSSNGLVGSEGAMICQRPDGGQEGVWWGLF